MASLNRLEELRAKCTRIQGGIKGEMATLIRAAKENIKEMVSPEEQPIGQLKGKTSRDEEMKKLREELDTAMECLVCVKEECSRLQKKHDAMKEKHQALYKEHNNMICTVGETKKDRSGKRNYDEIAEVVRTVLQEMGVDLKQGQKELGAVKGQSTQRQECYDLEANGSTAEAEKTGEGGWLVATRKIKGKKTNLGKKGPQTANIDGRREGGIRGIKPHKTAAIVIHCQEGTSYAEVIKKIDRDQDAQPGRFGIRFTKTRTTRTGGLLFEITGGKEGRKKADEFIKAAGKVIPDGARITCPRTKADMIVSRPDQSITEADITNTIAAKYDCDQDEITVKPIKIRPNRLGSAWISAPHEAVAAACNSGKIQIGWTLAKVTGTRDRPVQCHRCLEYGHLKGEWTSYTDRSMACYKCGENWHRVATCVNDPRCLLCPGMQNGHRMGSKMCKAVKEANVRREARRQRRNNKRKKKL